MKKYLSIFIILLPLSYYLFDNLRDSLLLLKEEKKIDSLVNERRLKNDDIVSLYGKLLKENKIASDIESNITFDDAVILYNQLLEEENKRFNKKDEPLSIFDANMIYSRVLTTCLHKHRKDIHIDCTEKILEEKNDNKNTKEDENNALIETIYLLMILTLNVQLSIFIYAYSEKEQIDKAFFHLSDWAINSPPMLGVLGTILSFALLVGNMDDGNILDVFTKSFFDAAITTIIGGLIYVFNLLLKVKIYTKIE